ncbi:hypothetical protein AHAS_Ahas03G0010100 [Arachis hypogaea]
MFYSETEKVGCEGEVKEGGEVCCSKEDGVVGGATPVSITGDGGSLKCSVVSMEKPFRRFTRSLLKRKLEDDVSGAKVGNDKVNNNAKAVEVGDDVKQEMEDGALVAVSKASTKRCPTSLKELLATGILEGVAVNYAHSVKVVTPTLFKLNASRLNKCPPEYIYLENGSTLRDVMNACLDVPLETLEEVVQKVIGGGLTIKKSTFCFNCRDANVVSRLFCNSCMELKECPPNLPTQTTDTSNCNVSLAVQSSRMTSLVSGIHTLIPGTHCGSKSINNGMKHSTSRDKSDGKVTTKDLRLHKLIFEADVLPDGTEVAYYVHGKRLLDGYKRCFGIVCSCCDKELLLLIYLHRYTSNGVSLHELSINYLKERKFSSSDNDDLCSICSDGGDLLCCDGCPRAFHIGEVPVTYSFPYCGFAMPKGAQGMAMLWYFKLVFDRGLIGVYHDCFQWVSVLDLRRFVIVLKCEPFSTYPRTYDLIHVASIASLTKDPASGKRRLITASTNLWLLLSDAPIFVLVIGATNRLDILDPALLRKGRFDKIIRVGLPSKDGRFAILKRHLDYIGRDELLEALKRRKGTFETGQEDSAEIPEKLKLRLAYREVAVAVLVCDRLLSWTIAGSDGAQTHLVNIQFQKKVRLQGVRSLLSLKSCVKFIRSIMANLSYMEANRHSHIII